MNAAQIIKELMHLNETQKRINFNNVKVTELMMSIKKDENLIRFLDGVKIKRGKPVDVWHPSDNATVVTAVADEHKARSGDMYLNAHNNKTYGVRFRRRNERGDGFDETFGGSLWATKKIALSLVYDWVLEGKLPDKVKF